jgi:hypothetical protein
MGEFIAKYWLQAIFGAIIGILGKVVLSYKNKYDSLKCSFSAMECVMLELSKSKMLDIYYEYRDLKRIPLHRLQSFEGLYNAYTSLGGNGIMTKKHEEVLGWDIEED